MSDKITGYEISWHPAHRPEHIFGGRQFTFEEMETQGINKMLQDYNCRHWKFPVIVGVTPPMYSEAELRRLEAGEQVRHVWRNRFLTLYDYTQLRNQYQRELARIGGGRPCVNCWTNR